VIYFILIVYTGIHILYVTVLDNMMIVQSMHFSPLG